MNIPRVRFVFDRQNRADSIKSKKSSKKKLGLVQVELYVNGKRYFYGTGIKLLKGQWDDRRYVVNHLEASVLNMRLNDLMLRMQENILAQTKANKFVVSDFSRSIFPELSNETSFLDAFEEMCDRVVCMNMSDSTRKLYSSVYESILRFNSREKAGNVMKKFEDMTPETLYEYEKWAISSGIKPVSLSTYHAKIKCVIKYSISKKKTDIRNPYDSYKQAPYKDERIKYLTESELKKLEKYVPESITEQYALDMWMFMRYTGMSFIDAYRFVLSENAELIDGRYIVRGFRVKTGVQYTIVLVDPAVKLLDKYGGTFSRLKISYLNNRLHKIGKDVIGRRITTKMARHTYAVWALHEKVSLPVVSRMIGHTDVKTTQIYAKVLAEDVIDEFTKLEDAVSKKK